MSTRLHGLLALAAALALGAHAVPATFSTFTAATTNEGSTITASSDWSAPHVTAVVAQKTQGGSTGRIRQGGSFYVFADASDSGSPPSKVATVTATVGTVATTTTTTLTAGTYTAGGVTYGYRSPALTARTPLAGGSYTLSVKATDAAGNPSPVATGTVTVDNTAVAGADVATTDLAGNTGLAQTGDKLTLTYSKPVEPGSIVAGWDGSARSTPVKLTDGSVVGLGGMDVIGAVDAAGTVLPTGYVTLSGDYVANKSSVTFNGSTMTASGNTVVLRLGTPESTSTLKDDKGNRIATWTPAAAAYDQAGNPAAATPVPQSGPARKQF